MKFLKRFDSSLNTSEITNFINSKEKNYNSNINGKTHPITKMILRTFFRKLRYQVKETPPLTPSHIHIHWGKNTHSTVQKHDQK